MLTSRLPGGKNGRKGEETIEIDEMTPSEKCSKECEKYFCWIIFVKILSAIRE